MNLKVNSYYTKLVLFLSTASILVYIVLNIYLFNTIRTKISAVIREGQESRIEFLFKQIDMFGLKSTIDRNYIEYSFTIYSPEKTILFSTDTLSKTTEFNVKQSAFDILHVFTNKNEASNYRYIVAQLNPLKKPVLYETFYYHGIAFSILFLISAFIGLVIVKRLNRRLYILLDGINRVKSGELDHQINLSGTDELANVADAYNKMAETLSETFEELKESNEAQKRFLAHASHEIKTPLTSLRGIIDIVSFMDVMPADKSELIDIAKLNIKEINRLNDQILSLAEIKSTEYNIKLNRMDIVPLLKQELITAKIQSENKSLSVEDSIHLDHFVSFSHVDHFSQVLANLMQNAFKYAKAGSTIKVETKQITDGLLINISNESQNCFAFCFVFSKRSLFY